MRSTKAALTGASLIHEISKFDKEKEIVHKEQIQQDFEESVEYLNQFNRKLQAANEKRSSTYKNRISSLVDTNMKTHNVRLGSPCRSR